MEAHEYKITKRMERILGPVVDIHLDDCVFMKYCQGKLFAYFRMKFQKRLKMRIIQQQNQDRQRWGEISVSGSSEKHEKKSGDVQSEEILRNKKHYRILANNVRRRRTDAPEIQENSAKIARKEICKRSKEDFHKDSMTRASSYLIPLDINLYHRKEMFHKYTSPYILEMDTDVSISELYALAEKAIQGNSTFSLVDTNSVEQQKLAKVEDEESEFLNKGKLLPKVAGKGITSMTKNDEQKEILTMEITGGQENSITSISSQQLITVAKRPEKAPPKDLEHSSKPRNSMEETTGD